MLKSLPLLSYVLRLATLLLPVMLPADTVRGDDTTPLITIDTPMSPPTWALLERQLLDANTKACEEFYEKYFDERGFLLCVERWGGDDGPDDAIENCLHWPILHAIGGGDSVLTNYRKAWEGHLRQYTLAKTVDVPFARLPRSVTLPSTARSRASTGERSCRAWRLPRPIRPSSRTRRGLFRCGRLLVRTA